MENCETMLWIEANVDAIPFRIRSCNGRIGMAVADCLASYEKFIYNIYIILYIKNLYTIYIIEIINVFVFLMLSFICLFFFLSNIETRKKQGKGKKINKEEVGRL